MSNQNPGDQTEAELEKTRQVVRENIEAQAGQAETAAADLQAQAQPEATEAEGYDTWTKEELAEELRTRELAVSGSKDELIARLQEDDA